MIPPLIAIGGRGRTTLYMHRGYDKPGVAIDILCNYAENQRITDKIFLLIGDPKNPMNHWPIYAIVYADKKGPKES